MSKVDFILIGAMKSGSTTLVDYLRLHPAIHISRVKEPQFFSRKHKYDLGISWYEALFESATPGQLLGEGSTCYSRWPKYDGVPERILQYNPAVKLIYVMRHPVDRTYSHFRHSMLKNEINYQSFNEALEFEAELIDSSKYMMQIERYREVFPDEQLLLINFEDLIENKDKTLGRIFDYLGVNKADYSSNELSSNQAGNVQTKNQLIKYLRIIRRLPLISTLVDRLVPPATRAKIIKKTSQVLLNSAIGKYLVKKKVRSVPVMTTEDRKYILEKCHDDLQKLEDFTKWDLHKWYI